MRGSRAGGKRSASGYCQGAGRAAAGRDFRGAATWAEAVAVGADADARQFGERARPLVFAPDPRSR